MVKVTHPIPPESAHAARIGHENSDASIVAIVSFVVIMLGTVALLSVYIWHQMHGYVKANEQSDSQPSPFVASRPAPPEPRLQPEYQSHDRLPFEDMAALKQEWAAQLSTYGTVPGRPGTARIPIDRAMDLLAARGLPPTTAPATTPPPKPIGGGR